jgi:hypothetical protein
VWRDCGLPAGQAERRVTEAGPVRRLRRAERCTQILDAATRASAHSGFVTTSLDEVAAEAGITHMILYRHPFLSQRLINGRVRSGGES